MVSYSKQTVKIVGRISVTCTHTTTIKKIHFYVTDIIDTKVILGLQFCRAFNLVTINCNEHCECKKVAVDIINSEFPRGLDPGNHSTKVKPPHVDINLKLRPDCKTHIMELYPDLFKGVGTMDGAHCVKSWNHFKSEQDRHQQWILDITVAYYSQHTLGPVLFH